MKKRLLSTLLALCMALALLPAALAADTDFVMEGGVLVKYQGSGGAVTIPDGVTTIGNGAFDGCDSLTSVTIPNSVTTIEYNAFSSCHNLSSVTIPNSVTFIDESVFYDCTGLVSITIPNSVTYIGVGAFSDCVSLTGITLPDSVTSVVSQGFTGCTSLSSVTIPAGVTSIDWAAFLDCTSLDGVTIPDGVTYIGEQAFWGCTGLSSVTIPGSVTVIDDSAFYGCTGLTDVYYGGSESQWKQISISDGNYLGEPENGNAPLLGATIHYNDSTSAEPEQPAAPSTPSTPATPAGPMPEVVLSPQKLSVDGEDVRCEKYNIGGSNYFKLRDLAYALNGTGSQFGVGFDEATATVSITTGAAYEPIGTEMATGVDNSATAQPSSQSILIDGEAHAELTVYNIGGSNFFQLRELGNVLGFTVDFDADTNTAVVLSTQE